MPLRDSTRTAAIGRAGTPSPGRVLIAWYWMYLQWVGVYRGSRAIMRVTVLGDPPHSALSWIRMAERTVNFGLGAKPHQLLLVWHTPVYPGTV